jgi:hypothetical protein
MKWFHFTFANLENKYVSLDACRTMAAYGIVWHIWCKYKSKRCDKNGPCHNYVDICATWHTRNSATPQGLYVKYQFTLTWLCWQKMHGFAWIRTPSSPWLGLILILLLLKEHSRNHGCRTVSATNLRSTRGTI